MLAPAEKRRHQILNGNISLGKKIVAVFLRTRKRVSALRARVLETSYNANTHGGMGKEAWYNISVIALGMLPVLFLAWWLFD